jgi:hypothetical protein
MEISVLVTFVVEAYNTGSVLEMVVLYKVACKYGVNPKTIWQTPNTWTELQLQASGMECPGDSISRAVLVARLRLGYSCPNVRDPSYRVRIACRADLSFTRLGHFIRPCRTDGRREAYRLRPSH